jgi:hypothetical protein
MQNSPNEIFGNSVDGQSMQNRNMGRSDQQATGEGEKLDLHIPQPFGETCPDQRGPASNFDLYDVSVSRSQMNTPKNKSHPKGLPMAWSGKKEKMGPCGLGEGLQNQNSKEAWGYKTHK